MSAEHDAEAYGVVFDQHHRALLRLAYLLCGDERRAEDVVSEAFAKVFPRWRAGGVDDVRAYLRRSVVNVSHGGFRRLAIERREAQRIGHRGDDRGTRPFDQDAVDRDALWRALDQLPERQRIAVVLRYYEDLSEADAAEVMQTSVGTVKSQTARGLDKLRTLMGEEER